MLLNHQLAARRVCKSYLAREQHDPAAAFHAHGKCRPRIETRYLAMLRKQVALVLELVLVLVPVPELVEQQMKTDQA